MIPDIEKRTVYRIAIVGGESTGKTTLSVSLAHQLGCLWVPEFARYYLDAAGPKYSEPEVVMMARGQVIMEDAMARQQLADVRPVLVCDTNLVVFYVWLQHSYNRVPDWITDALAGRRYDLTLLCAPTLPWQEDPLREHPDLQDYFFEQYQQVLRQFDIPYRSVDATKFSVADLATDLELAGV
jgi:NadR type nicotinamide-nucleotide adenylyltransferase